MMPVSVAEPLPAKLGAHLQELTSSSVVVRTWLAAGGAMTPAPDGPYTQQPG